MKFSIATLAIICSAAGSAKAQLPTRGFPRQERDQRALSPGGKGPTKAPTPAPAPPPPPCAACEDGFFTYQYLPAFTSSNGQGYTFLEAAASVPALGCFLISATEAHEIGANFLMTGSDNIAWVGAYKPLNKLANNGVPVTGPSLLEGWENLDLTPWVGTYWAPNEPNNAPQPEGYVRIQKDNNLLYDAPNDVRQFGQFPGAIYKCCTSRCGTKVVDVPDNETKP